MSHPLPSAQRLLPDGDERRPRADAQRNVERLVAAARAAVAEVGIAVTAHEIARRAGVGIGTFYRRVPSREALLEAVLAELLGEAVAEADRALQNNDPWAGLCEFATAYVRLRAASCGVNEALGEECGLDLDLPLEELRDRIRSLVERAQTAAAVRRDVTWQDVAFLLAAVVPGQHTIGLQADDQQWIRNLQIVLDGLRLADMPR
ncbi:AcrR family transcriptional regulator [Hamadaea flava]|uniref:TetR/AcrR family transcriptional regulator n=1 Tax=Hamadaea flava TaxID=1742688 RepID=A0ABV8LZW0_9ACTN|nr:TetR family transcriptional regulator [Hamadaea flava]MCP2323483.1 AcrR family transcriptional regulator [Hamadaea flava]